MQPSPRRPAASPGDGIDVGRLDVGWREKTGAIRVDPDIPIAHLKRIAKRTLEFLWGKIIRLFIIVEPQAKSRLYLLSIELRHGTDRHGPLTDSAISLKELLAPLEGIGGFIPVDQATVSRH